jgi:thymidylate synthase
MKKYQELLQNIINNGVEKESGRANMPNTIGISHATIEMDLNDGFPLLTTKKMYWKGIVHELLWFLRGETNIKYLVDNKVNIWNSDAYRWYLKHHTESGYNTPPLTMEMFVDEIKNNKITDSHFNNSSYKLGDLGKVYGHQWRNQNGVDQVKDVLYGLKTNPYSRYHIIDGWNKADFPEMALPPCHLLYQFIVRPLLQHEREQWAWDNGLKEKYQQDAPKMYDEWTKWLDEHNVPKFYLDLNMYQRSVDVGLGLSFNLASMSLLLMIFAKASNMLAGKAFWIGGDTHIYLSHVDGLKEQLKREPFPLPKLLINKDLSSLDDILNLNIDDFELINYQSHPTIKLELFTGVKK